jgi:hypothetical protein
MLNLDPLDTLSAPPQFSNVRNNFESLLSSHGHESSVSLLTQNMMTGWMPHASSSTVAPVVHQNTLRAAIPSTETIQEASTAVAKILEDTDRIHNQIATKLRGIVRSANVGYFSLNGDKDVAGISSENPYHIIVAADFRRRDEVIKQIKEAIDHSESLKPSNIVNNYRAMRTNLRNKKAKLVRDISNNPNQMLSDANGYLGQIELIIEKRIKDTQHVSSLVNADIDRPVDWDGKSPYSSYLGNDTFVWNNVT